MPLQGSCSEAVVPSGSKRRCKGALLLLGLICFFRRETGDGILGLCNNFPAPKGLCRKRLFRSRLSILFLAISSAAAKVLFGSDLSTARKNWESQDHLCF